MMVRRLGIDPAPSKGLVVFDPEPQHGQHFLHVGARQARQWLSAQRAEGPLLVGWDAPIFVDFSSTYTERPIEKYLKGKLGAAVSVLGFSSCQHWTISLDVLGRPLPDSLVRIPDDRLALRFPGDKMEEGGVIETHPAVAVAVLWDEVGDVPRYKMGISANERRHNQACIQAVLTRQANRLLGTTWVPLPGHKDTDLEWDDYVDAQVSFLCVEALVKGRALLLGDRTGGFIVPRTDIAEHWQADYEGWLHKWQQAARTMAQPRRSKRT
jgi:hypothetical protein